MAGDFTKKVQSENKHHSNMTSARFIHIDGSKPQVIVRNRAGRLLRAVIATAGVVCTIRNGTTVVGNVSSTATGTLNFGVYCDTNITVDVTSGTGSLCLVYDE